ncbi:MAG: helix-turn-helix transcriptional regulator [Anaerolineales bacterium]|nr:helix-turn-helix transcriptional regulator [Anaerolineales bacterium]
MATGTRFLRVSEIREQAGISVEELATRADIAYNTALSYERDVSELISKKVLRKIAKALGVRVRDLIADDEETN